MNAIILFIICTTVNVVLNTVKSIVTVKGGKGAAAAVNAICFGFYTYIIILTATADLTTWEKIIITTACNLVGVYIVKWIEEKMRKDKLWKVEVTIPNKQVESLLADCLYMNIEHYSYWDAYNYKVFNFYCATQKESAEVRELLKNYNVKYFVTESKVL